MQVFKNKKDEKSFYELICRELQEILLTEKTKYKRTYTVYYLLSKKDGEIKKLTYRYLFIFIKKILKRLIKLVPKKEGQ